MCLCDGVSRLHSGLGHSLVLWDEGGDISAVWSLLHPVQSVSAGAVVPTSKQG